MTRAEERALEAYPNLEPPTFFDETYPRILFTRNTERHAYVEGYEQAEKDLALTIQDLELLHTFLYAVKNNKHGAFTFTRLTDEQYSEVLKRFKEAKK